MEKSIAAETLASYENFSERDSRIDRMRGQEDGEQNYPSRDALSFSTYEQTKIADARSAINQYTRRMRQSIDRLSMEIRDKKLQRDEDYGSRKRALNDDLTAQLKRQNTLIGIESQEHAELSDQLEETERAQRISIHRHGRGPRMRLHQTVFNHPLLSFISQPYVAFLLLLALLETPINSFAVELAIGFLPPISWLVAFLVGLVFVLIAHFIGIQMRRLFSGTWITAFWRLIVLALSLLLALIMIYVLFAMRGEVTSLIAPQGGINLPILGPAPANDPSPAALGGSLLSLIEDPLRKYFSIGGVGILSDETKFAQLGLLMLNSLVLIIGVVLSFVRHDPCDDLEATSLALFAARRRMNHFLRNFRRAQAETQEKFGRAITELQREADQINNEVVSLENQRDQLLAQMDNEVRQIFIVLAQQITAYQDGNRKARTHDVPTYFGVYGMRKLGEEILAE